ncbi:MAG: AMP-binding protein [Kiritimatiellae bacterium]|nr:AMP-binding protein [Kiritimatiellia bacterium]
MNDKIFSLSFNGAAVITDDGRAVSYAELKQLTDAWGARVPPRSLVFLLVGNNLDSLVAYVACLNHGIVPLMLDAHIDGQLLNRFVAIYQPDFIWEPVNGAYILEPRNKQNIRKELHSDLALLLTTSGSTGSPKLVRQSYDNIRANTASIVEYLKLESSERPITTLPMNYTYGLSIINSHLAVGATILLTEKSIMQREFWNFFSEQGATSFGGVPYTYEMLDKLMFFRRKLPSLRTMTQAGGKILPDLHRKFAEYAKREGKNFVVMYGQCEATARMSYLPPERTLDKVGSMGIAIPGGRFTLIDDSGNAVTEPDVTGELVYEGANVTLGYAECADDLAKGDERHGRLVTGDMAKRDAEGFYYIVGRKKRFLKIFGNRVNLDETERLIKGAFPGLDCACGGVDDKMKIYVVVDSNHEIHERHENEIRDFVAEKTHLNFTAFEIVSVLSIPKNASGKTLYSELP